MTDTPNTPELNPQDVQDEDDLDVVEYNNDDYMVMIPLDDEEIEDDDEQDEVVILKVIREGDEETYSGVEDEDVLNAVFEIFQEQNAEEDED